MKSVRPPPGAPAAPESDLTEEESYVLSRVDRRRSLREIAEMSGISEDRVSVIVDTLVERGAVEPAAPDEPPSRAAIPSADESGAYTYQALGAPVAEDEPSGDLFPTEAMPAEERDSGQGIHARELPNPLENMLPESMGGGLPDLASYAPDEDFGDAVEDGAVPYAGLPPLLINQMSDEPAWGEDIAEAVPGLEYEGGLMEGGALPLDEAERFAAAFAAGAPLSDETREAQSTYAGGGYAGDAPLPAETDPDVLEELGPVSEEAEKPEHKEEQEKDEEGDDDKNYRRLFETKFHRLTPDVRVGLASKVTDPELSALCLDPDPKVIGAVIANTAFGLQHARLIAFHHRTPTGLEHIASHHELVKDGLVFRRLIRNTQLAAPTLRRIMQPRRLIEIYKVSIDHDLPELARTASRGLLRTKFSSQSQPEQRCELIVNTEARVLQVLSGCVIDGRTTQMLCGRQVYSAMFVQNVARFGAAPPMLLAHLAKQPFVRRNPGLKKMLMQHPNMPGDVKRSM